MRPPPPGRHPASSRCRARRGSGGQEIIEAVKRLEQPLRGLVLGRGESRPGAHLGSGSEAAPPREGALREDGDERLDHARGAHALAVGRVVECEAADGLDHREARTLVLRTEPVWPQLRRELLARPRLPAGEGRVGAR